MSNPTRASRDTGDVYTSRRPLLERATGATTAGVAVLLLVPVLPTLLAAPAHHLRPQDLTFVPFLLVVCLALTLPALLALRPRLTADADGLHVRNVLSRHDLPWPTSRAELVVVPAVGLRRLHTTTVQYRPADGTRAVTIHALARPATTVLEDPGADQEAQDLWEWGQRHGHVPSGTARQGAVGARPGPVGASPGQAAPVPAGAQPPPDPRLCP